MLRLLRLELPALQNSTGFSVAFRDGNRGLGNEEIHVIARWVFPPGMSRLCPNAMCSVSVIFSVSRNSSSDLALGLILKARAIYGERSEAIKWQRAL